MRVKNTKISCPLGTVKHLSYGRVTPNIVYTQGYTEKVIDEKVYYRGHIVFEEDTVIIPAKHPLLVFEQPDAWWVKYFDIVATVNVRDNNWETEILKNVFVESPKELSPGETYWFPQTVNFTAKDVMQTRVTIETEGR